MPQSESRSGSDPDIAVSHSDGAASAAVNAEKAAQKAQSVKEQGYDLDDLVALAMGGSEKDPDDRQPVDEDVDDPDAEDDDEPIEDDETEDEEGLDEEEEQEEQGDEDDDAGDEDDEEEDADDDSSDPTDEDRKIANSKVGKENAKLRKRLREAEAKLAEVTESSEVGKSILAFEKDNNVDRDTLNGFLGALASAQAGDPQALIGLTGAIAKESGQEFMAGEVDPKVIDRIAKTYFMDDEDVEALKKAIGPSPAPKEDKPKTVLPKGTNDGNAAIQRFRAKLIEEVGEAEAKRLEPKLVAEAKTIAAEAKARGIAYTDVNVLLTEAKERVLPSSKKQRPKAKRRAMRSRGSGYESPKAMPEGKTKEDGLSSLAEKVAAGLIA